MSEDPTPKPLDDLGAQIERLKAETKPRASRGAADTPTSGMGIAFALASHMVAGLGGGALIGYFLDQWLDTSPWLLVVFFFLGSAAGMLNVYRMASGMGMAMGYRPATSRNADRNEGMRRAGESPADGGNKEEGGR